MNVGHMDIVKIRRAQFNISNISQPSVCALCAVPELQVEIEKRFKTLQQESVMLNLFQHLTSFASALLNCKILNQVQDDNLLSSPMGEARWGLSRKGDSHD